MFLFNLFIRYTKNLSVFPTNRSADDSQLSLFSVLLGLLLSLLFTVETLFMLHQLTLFLECFDFVDCLAESDDSSYAKNNFVGFSGFDVFERFVYYEPRIGTID